MQAPDAHHAQLAAMADRIGDIADTVAADAEAATRAVRSVATNARHVADLAAGLAETASLLETGVREQSEALAAARQSIATDQPAIEALAGAIATISSVSALIGAIAGQSRLLSINAQIEAAHAGAGGAGFSVVAREMSALASETRSATNEIARRTGLVAEDVERARRIALSTADLVMLQDEALGLSLANAGAQRNAAEQLTGITADTAAQLEDAAAGIGRVASAASAMKLLARQVGRLTAGAPVRAAA